VLGLLASVHTNVEYVAAAEDHITVVCRQRISTVLARTFQDNIHVAVGVDHASAIFNIVLEPNAYFTVQFLYEEIERFSGRLQRESLRCCQFPLALNNLAAKRSFPEQPDPSQ